MSGEPETESMTVEDPVVGEFEFPITARVVLGAMLGGLLGTVVMLPVMVGVPQALGLFRTEPITEFASFSAFFGVEPTLVVGMVLFGFGGTVVLPLIFLVVGSFLPPKSPRYLRGVTFATAFWSGFAPAFWPAADALTVTFFVVFSLLGHWCYGITLGYVLHRTTGIPQHTV